MSFFALDAGAPKFFGFSEFLTALALMVIAWTLADIRYRFRLRTAPLPLQGITFSVVATIGVLTLLTDLWRAQEWPVPEGDILTPATWQAVLGGVFLLTFLSWAWFAFMRPPIYGRMNALRYARSLYSAILKGSPSELSVIADEFARSVRSLIRHATNRAQFEDLPNDDVEANKPKKKPPRVTAYADDILLLIADRRFCRAVVGSSPRTARAVFREMAETKKYGVKVQAFARNIVDEALLNKDSFLFSEAEGYETGLLGYQKPLSQSMFSNYRLVERVGTLLDIDTRKWDPDQWKAYCRVVMMTFRDYVETDFWNHSFVLYRAKSYMEHAAFELYKLNGTSTPVWDNDVCATVRVIVGFIKDAVEILDKKGVPDHRQLGLRVRHDRSNNFYDHLSSMILEVISSASLVRSPVDLCWWIQHNTVWGELFNFGKLDGPAARVVKFKVRRLIYDEVSGMRRFPNFKGAKILGFCLNVMGLTSDPRYDKDSRALHKAILSWAKQNYAWLYSYNPRVGEACLVDGMTYDQENLRIVKTQTGGLLREPHHEYLRVDPPPNSESTAEEASPLG